MLFNSQVFIVMFFPLVVILYYGAHKLGLHKGALGILFLASLFFYGYYNPVYLLLLLGSIALNYTIYICLKRCSASAEKGPGITRKLLLILGVGVNLLVLFYFKYFHFFINNVNRLFHTDIRLHEILLPLGISFFTFQQISFVVDAYREKTGDYGLLEYCVFVSFFPQLVAGPIVLHEQMIPQLSDKERWQIQPERFTNGLRYFVMGLFKKTIVADHFGYVVTAGYANPAGLDALGTVFLILSYTIQIYFDFSGYSDMAIGLGAMLGIDIPMNFNMPYKASDIGEFWKRWHMTMTGFFTKYLYFPLGGNRKGLFRTCINTMIVFAFSGLWHGAGWSFVLWGVMHGAALVFHRIFQPFVKKIPGVVTGFVTFCFVNVAWVFFRADSGNQAIGVLSRLLSGVGGGNTVYLCREFLGTGIPALVGDLLQSVTATDMVIVAVTVLALVVTLLVVFLAPSSHQICQRYPLGKREGILWGVMFVAALMTFNRVSTFLYFNF